MGHLDEKHFAATIAGCAGSSGQAFEITTYIDRQVSVMLGDPNDDGRWGHDGEKLIDGTTRIVCLGCKRVAYESSDCPRCHAADGLARAAGPTRMDVPQRCPSCNSLELTVIGLAPALVRTAPGSRPTQPAALALLGEDGFHVMALACDDCDWVAVSEPCPLCGAPPPLRPRP
jgi:RNA polymerase subunit RPABC4/transcription elongation factor Spt4